MPNIGDILVCSETGKTFTAAKDGVTTNYATDSEGRIFSDEGVDIRERRKLLDRSEPFFCYVSSNGLSVTGWKGNVLGTITKRVLTSLPFGREFSNWHGKEYSAYQIRDVHGGMWRGKGSPGTCIALYPMKGTKK